MKKLLVECGLPIFLFIFIVLYLSIITQSLYISNDASRYLLGSSIYNDVPFVESALGEYIALLYYQGRFLPYAAVVLPIYVPLHYLMMQDILVYKIVILALTVIDIYIAGNLVRYITKSDKLKYIAMIGILFSFPFATLYGHSAMYTFYCLMQSIALLLLIAIYAYLKYIDTNYKKYIVISIVFFVLAMFYYELAYSLVLLPVLLALIKNGWKVNSIKQSLPMVLAFIVCAALYFVMRKLFSVGLYEGIIFSFDIIAIARTYFYQVFSAVPLAAWFGGINVESFAHQYFIYAPLSILKAIEITDIIQVILWTIIVVAINLKKESLDISKKSFSILAVIGVYIWLAPASLAALSVKYQNELSFGVGYIHVFLQCFGVGIFIASFFYFSKYFNKKVKTVFSLLMWCVGTLILILVQINARVALDVLHTRYDSYNNNKAFIALKAGILPQTSREDVIITDSSLGNQALRGVNSQAFSMKLRKKILSVKHEEYIKNSEMHDKNVFLFETITEGHGNTFSVSLATISPTS